MEVQIKCICPPNAVGQPRHEHDTIVLRDTLDFRRAVALRNEAIIARQGRADLAEILATLTEGYLIHGIESWTLVDEKGKPVPVDHQAIRDRLLTHIFEATKVGDEADGLYAEAIIVPLLAEASSSSPPSSTTGSTSAQAKASSPSKSRKRPSPSSTTTTRTDGIAATSVQLAGGSSS